MHQEAKKKWFVGRDESEEDYRTEIDEFVKYVREGQDIEPIHAKVILTHHTEIQRYNLLVESLEKGDALKAFKNYTAELQNLDELYKLAEIEEKQLKESMRNASYINY